MTQISQVDLIVQQLENLSLAELQEIKSKVDDLIENKSGTKDIESLELESRKTGVLPATSFRGWTRLVTVDKTEDTPVKNIIDLVNDWMCDESGYDEETYPQIEATLNQSQ